jgi:eukaryotic translation initiation factor 2C
MPQMPVVNVGNGAHPVLVPMELCEVPPGQVSRKKLSAAQTTDMLKAACRKPAENARQIVGTGAQVLGLPSGNAGAQVRIDYLYINWQLIPSSSLLSLSLAYLPGRKC